MWSTSQTLERSQRRTSEIVTAGRKDKRAQRSKLPKPQESVEVMQKEVEGLRRKLQRASQEAKAKLQQENPVAGGLRTSHK